MTAQQLPPIIRQECTTCRKRCGLPQHWPKHFEDPCNRKVWHLTVHGAVDHVARLSRERRGEALVYECPISQVVHWHVANRKRGA